MKSLKILLIWLLTFTPVYAADNAVTLTAGAGVTMRTKDIGGGVQSPFNILGDASGASIYGTAGSANANVITVQGIASGTAQPVSLTSTTITGTVAVTQSTSPWTTSISGSTFTSGNFNVQCANCSGSGVSTVDKATFTASSSLFAGIGGFFQTTATTNPLTTGQQGMLQMTATRAAFVNLRDSSGTEIGTATTPVIISQSTAANLNATVTGSGSAGSPAAGVLTVQGSGAMTPIVISQSTASNLKSQVNIVSGGVASGAYASGSIASGALASGSIASGAMVDLLTVIGSKAAGTAATNSLLDGGVFNSSAPSLTNGQQAALQLTSAGSLHTTVDNTNANGQATAANSSPVVLASDKNVSMTPYPIGATAIISSNTGTISATTAGFIAVPGVSNYLCGFSIRANATAAATANSTVAGISPATLNFTQWTAPAASGLGVTEQVFVPCLQSSATNTAITATSAAPGSGGNVSVSAWGYRL